MYTIPGDNTWTVVLNKALSTWEPIRMTKNKTLCVLKFPLKKGDKSLEALSMTIDGEGSSAKLHLGWEPFV